MVEVKFVDMPDLESQLPDSPDGGAPGESISLEALAKQQGVTAVWDLDEISRLWPVNDDADELLAFLFRERAARRARVRKGAAQ